MIASLITLPYLYPQQREWGVWLYEQSVHQLGWSNPKARFNQFLPDPRVISIALLMAHELGDEFTENRLRAHVEEHFEPRTFGEENDRFGYFFGWDEPYPGGQKSALLMVPEVGGPGAWSRWSREANLAKFVAPTVEGVDYPSIGLCVARNDLDRGELLLGTYAATPSHAGRATTVRVVAIPDLDGVRVTCDGADFTAWRAVGPDAIELNLTIGQHDVVVRTGYHGRGAEVPVSRQRVASTTVATAPRAAAVLSSPAAAIAAAASCRCC